VHLLPMVSDARLESDVELGNVRIVATSFDLNFYLDRQFARLADDPFIRRSSYLFDVLN